MTTTSGIAALKNRLRPLKAAGRRAKNSVLRKVLIDWAARAVSHKPLSRDPSAERPRRVLIARYRYHGAQPKTGDSIEAFFLSNTLGATGLASVDSFFWDTDCGPFPQGDWRFLETVRRSAPDLIALSSYEPGYPLHVTPNAIRLVRTHWQIPVVAFWWDCCWDGFWESLRPILPFVDLHVPMDDPSQRFLLGRNANAARFMPMWTAVDPHLHNNPGRERDIGVSFLGQVTGQRSPRIEYLQHLMERNVAVYSWMTDKAAQPPYAKYVEVLQRSKIGLNFSHGTSWHCLKARVFETMACGALLLESTNDQTSRLFSAGREYVAFDSPAHLEDRIRYYLAHDDERADIAARGEQRVKQYYNHRVFWEAVFNRLGIPTQA